jgi:hypothetical protein
MHAPILVALYRPQPTLLLQGVFEGRPVLRSQRKPDHLLQLEHVGALQLREARPPAPPPPPPAAATTTALPTASGPLSSSVLSPALLSRHMHAAPSVQAMTTGGGAGAAAAAAAAAATPTAGLTPRQAGDVRLSIHASSAGGWSKTPQQQQATSALHGVDSLHNTQARSSRMPLPSSLNHHQPQQHQHMLAAGGGSVAMSRAPNGTTARGAGVGATTAAAAAALSTAAPSDIVINTYQSQRLLFGLLKRPPAVLSPGLRRTPGGHC